MGLAFGYFNERVESYFYDKRVASPFFINTKAFKWLSIKSRVKGFLRMGIGVILDWFF
ncbi:hypothetical protein BSPWISOXPB_1333 [uncultured Gammaproteobacteria bacterium]|nr:hypothetical protein BSPWISOXPB_1333 [uncultured Gammaproteobacteria bacterium]